MKYTYIMYNLYDIIYIICMIYIFIYVHNYIYQEDNKLKGKIIVMKCMYVCMHVHMCQKCQGNNEKCIVRPRRRTCSGHVVTIPK